MFDVLNAKPVSMPIIVGMQLPRFDAQPKVKFPYRGSQLTALCGYDDVAQHPKRCVSLEPTSVRVRRKARRGG